MKKLVFLLLLFPVFGALAQNEEESLAAQFFNNQEYDKAQVSYEKLLGQKPASTYYYENLLSCYLALKDYKQAEKMVKRQTKQFPRKPIYKVDLGYVYQQSGNPEKAQKQYEKIVKELPVNEEIVSLTANAFIKREALDPAIATYLQGRKLFKAAFLFTLELAQVYARKGDVGRMVDEYLNTLLYSDEELETVQNYLQSYFANQGEYELLKELLLKKIKNYPNRIVFNEMLIWLFVQQKDFEPAFTQTRALDKRLREHGRRMVDLAIYASSNRDFDMAVQCYNYVINLGPGLPFYIAARQGKLDVINKKVLVYGTYTSQDLLELRNAYHGFLREFGHNYSTAAVMRELAHLQAFYLDQPDSALLLLEELTVMPRVSGNFRAECKLEMGDINLLTGDVWTAALLYGQVDKDKKEDPLGREAKFRNAKLYYYIGDFEWSKAQLDVLKTATTQLISNNALDLALLIQDNMGLDTSTEAMQLYARADLLLFQNKLDQSLLTLDSLAQEYPGHNLRDEILYTKAQVMMKRRDYEQAAAFYHQIIDQHGGDILGDNAVFEAAQLYDYRLDNPEQAQKLYEKLILEYPGSLFIVEARKRFRSLRGDNLN